MKKTGKRNGPQLKKASFLQKYLALQDLMVL
jgi:hypothetical protein